RGVVAGEEEAQDDILRDDLRVEGHLERLRVAGRPAAHLLVGGVLDIATGVAADDGGDSARALVDGVEAPEASGTQGESLHVPPDTCGGGFIPVGSCRPIDVSAVGCGAAVD